MVDSGLSNFLHIHVSLDQGDSNGRIFAYWAIFLHFGQFFWKITKEAQIFWLLFPTVKVMY
jgi:hypothetical protein